MRNERVPEDTNEDASETRFGSFARLKKPYREGRGPYRPDCAIQVPIAKRCRWSRKRR